MRKDRERLEGSQEVLVLDDSRIRYLDETFCKADRVRRMKFVAGIIYRPPDLDEAASASLMQELARASRYDNVCVMGDFNYRRIDWNSMIGDGCSEEFLNVVQDGLFSHNL